MQCYRFCPLGQTIPCARVKCMVLKHLFFTIWPRDIDYIRQNDWKLGRMYCIMFTEATRVKSLYVDQSLSCAKWEVLEIECYHEQFGCSGRGLITSLSMLMDTWLSLLSKNMWLYGWRVWFTLKTAFEGKEYNAILRMSVWWWLKAQSQSFFSCFVVIYQLSIEDRLAVCESKGWKSG